MSNNGIGLRISGPAANGSDKPVGAELDARDAREDPRVAAWADVRSGIVELAKRYQERVSANKQLAPPASAATESDADPSRDIIQDDGIEPPFQFEMLCTLFENSNALRQNIDAMATNIDGLGHRFEPVIDFTDPNVNNEIRDIMVRQRIGDQDISDITREELAAATPSVDEVEDEKQFWQQLASIEKGRIEAAFEFVNPIDTFTEIRTATRESLELLGNAAWEIHRQEDTAEGAALPKIQQVYFIPFNNIRLLPQDKNPVVAEQVVRKDKVTFETIEVTRFFRKFVRNYGSTKIYYKEFGDPRVVSRVTGRTYESDEELQRVESNPEDDTPIPQAVELLHWKIRSPVSPYGVPRWIGSLLPILGSRAAEEVNFLYFDNKTVPPMVLLVSGGRVSESDVERIESYLEDQIRGRQNFHKIMVLEALPAGADPSEGDVEHHGTMRVELKPLLQAQNQDALFQNYDANNQLKIGRAFRQPPIMTGDTRDLNRSTSATAKALAEEQIYQPARDAFDAVMNRHFLTNHQIRYWRFKTNAPVQRLPNDLVNNVVQSLKAGALTPNEGRELLADAFSTSFSHRSEEWAQIPPELAKVAARSGEFQSANPIPDEELEGLENDLAEMASEQEDDTEEPLLTEKQWRALAHVRSLARARQVVEQLVEDKADEMFDPKRPDDEEIA